MRKNLRRAPHPSAQRILTRASKMQQVQKIQDSQISCVSVFSMSYNTKSITLEDIYKKETFRIDDVVASFGESKADAPAIQWDQLTDASGKKISPPDEVIVCKSNSALQLLIINKEPIYRRSSKSLLYLFNAKDSSLLQIGGDTKSLHPQFSPDGQHLSYIQNNNLMLYNIATGTRTTVTTDGKWNYIINGNCDWVYEEEFEFSRAYEWNPKGNYIAYYRFDESGVKEFNITVYDNAHNSDYRYKYPKAGDDNSVVEIHIYDVNKANKAKAQYETGDIYIPRIKWATDDRLIVFWMNRHQNVLKLLNTDAATGNSSLLYEEKNKYFVEINDDWWFLKDAKHYLFTSEMNGYRHIYLYGLDGTTKKQLTKGNVEVTKVNGVDEVNKRIFYTLAWPRPMDRNLFVTDFNGENTYELTQGNGWNCVSFNDDFSKFILYYSNINTPQTVSLQQVLVDNKKGISAVQEKVFGTSPKLKVTMRKYGFGAAEFMQIPNSKGDMLNSWMLKPAGFDAVKKYPVLFCNYGGPGSQQVANRFGAVSNWHQLLAQKGFIVVSVDNTGTGYRGEEFKKKTYLKLGKLEIEDQIDAANYLAKQPWVDKTKIGHWGWSYGGFMSSLAITKGAGIFSAAVAVAPVTSWRFYNNIYTERYMRTPKENPGGYDDNSPINHTDKIKGKYLIIHGTADDNAHFQNSTQMISALVKSNIDFESAYYPNKNHSISGMADNTTFHLWSKKTNWILNVLGNENTLR